MAQVAAGEPLAIDRFLGLASPVIWSAVVRLEGEGAAGEAAFLRVIEALKSDGYSGLKAFDGRSTLASFLALFSRRVLIQELSGELAAAPDAAWRRFERIFGPDIRRRVSNRFPRADSAAREDLFQEVCLGLLQDDFRRLRAFNDKGSFEGFVLVLIDRLLIDLLRKETPRLRLPADVERMQALDRAVFIATAWKGAPLDLQRVFERLEVHHENLNPEAVAAAIERVRSAVEAERTRRHYGQSASIEDAAERGEPIRLTAETGDPEQEIIERQQASDRAAMIATITAAAETWPADERLYLQTFLSTGAPPRVIAQLMARPVEDVRQIQQRAMRRIARTVGVMKTTGTSVYGTEE